MDDLLVLLGTQQEEIVGAIEEKLSPTLCPVLMQTEAGRSESIFEAFRDCCSQNSDVPARQWARRLRGEAPDGVPPQEVLTALNYLEWAVRLHIVRTIQQRRTMLMALETLGGTVDWLRRAFFDRRGPEAAVVRLPIEDLAGFVNGSRTFICLANLQGRPYYLNPAGRSMVGLEPDEPLEPATFHRFHGAQAWEELRENAVPAVREEGRWEGRSRLQHLITGEQFEVMTTMFLVNRPGAERASCLALVHRPLSAFEDKLSEVEARKHAILESSLDPIITINHEGVVTEFNRAAEQVFGHPRSEVLGTRPSEVLFPPSSSAGHRNRIDRYLNMGEGSMLGQRVEVTAARASGETFPAELAMTISQEGGAPVMTFFVRDISGRKKAEREQARYAAELERSNNELEQFAYVASHDLQEPLRKIRTFGDRLEMKCADKLDDVGRQCVGRMQSAAARMQQLIDGLLNLSRVTTRGQEFEPVDLAAVAREVIGDLEVRIEQLEGRVELGKLPTIQADRVQIRQLFQNLIGNALKFHRAGEPPLVRVEGHFLHRPEQRAPGSASQEKCLITVKDNGIGIDERHRERIFDVFQRLHPRERYEGTGVGLAICRKIVDRHGGEINVSGEVGQGTTFEIILPAVHGKRRRRSSSRNG
jgi:PAS domain S-box-containing protein